MIPHVRNKCPKCGSDDLEIYRTEKMSATYIVRYYQCRGCTARFKTEQAG